MKLFRLALLATGLAGSALLVSAGPGPQYWSRPALPKSTAPALAAATPTAPSAPSAECSTCSCCKKG